VVQSDVNQFGVSVELLPSGTERMRQATASHVGRPVAILVDGKVVTAPVLRSPIGSSALINGNYTRAVADAIAEGLEKP
jgi:preprotein translocase subunit SecD